MKKLLSGLIRIYQLFFHSAFPSCRFQPTCSNYAIEALNTHGVFKGILLSAWRLCRCHPFSKGGLDPVPEAKVVNKNTPRCSI